MYAWSDAKPIKNMFNPFNYYGNDVSVRVAKKRKKEIRRMNIETKLCIENYARELTYTQ